MYKGYRKCMQGIGKLKKLNTGFWETDAVENYYAHKQNPSDQPEAETKPIYNDHLNRTTPSCDPDCELSCCVQFSVRINNSQKEYV